MKYLFLNRNNEVPKPTIALDYTFCRKAKSGSSVVSWVETLFFFAYLNFKYWFYIFVKLKHIGHIWELGEGTFLMKLIDVVVNPENIL